MNRYIRSATILIASLLLVLSWLPEGKASSYDPVHVVTGTVIKVFDGDTIWVLTPERKKIKVRLYGIDAPEAAVVNQRTGKVSVPGQPFSDESRSYLSSLILNKTVRLLVIYTDRNGRVVSIVLSDNRNVNLEMVKAGMAESYKAHLEVQPYWKEILRADIEATSKKIGIWSQQSYERPSDFRKRMKVKGR